MRTRKTQPTEDQGLFEEALIAIGVLLIVAGLWARVGALSLIVPGIVALWIGLPARGPFVAATPEPPKGRTSV